MRNDTKIIAEGPENYKHSKAYREKVSQIILETKTKYQLLIDNETNLLIKLFLKLKMVCEVQRAVYKLNSPGKMYLKTKGF
jgi:hypothetical protein